MAPVQLTDLIVTVATAHAGALDRLAAAVSLSDQLDELGDHLIGHFVDEARRTGASWTDIGESIGVSKQAAQKRFVPKESPELSKPSFDRFTQRSHRVINLARHHARFSQRIGSEHLLLGLLDETGGLAAKTITKLEASDGTTRIATLTRLVDESHRKPDPQPFSTHCKKALELAVREALRMGHTFIGTEHILLGLLAEEEGTAAQVLRSTGVSYELAEKHIRDVIGAVLPTPREG
ncbi:Clp protease N-terminal domain-containing protein [Lentzea sp. NBRC 105346]|uniref:Clp protease N-terminal domain-containing protein n=1 Tax=Lentzea sp. NBRC 105346 TaxID=3032205 RepID=UPI00255617FB|nr:Clp protease N-terminal domain-containing protein [Lentzea sp. NBRC 105346]